MKKVLLSVVALMSLATTTLAQTVPNYVPTNGLVGWWPFNGNANDESGNGNNGTVNGATLTTDRFGNAGKAYSFDGVNDYINLNSSITNNFSFNTWFKIDNFNLSNCNPNIGSYCNTSILSSINNALGSFNFQLTLTYNGKLELTNFDANILYQTTVLNLNQWYNCSFTYFNGLANFYFNDNLVYTHNYNASINNNVKWQIGARPNNPAEFFFNGKIDDIGIWNRALTQQEITDLYNANICYDHVTVTDTLIINTNMVGFNPVTYQNTIKVWPNPAHDHITIDNGNIANLSGYQIKISNVLGQQVFQSAINQQQFYINLSTWTGNGTYYINLINPQGVTVETRVIVVQ